ncbi:MAG: heavy-metal-associated domain-containing protein [Rickettsiales bacterium]
MKRTLLITTTLALLSTGAYAGEIHAKVKGLVCAFCAQGVEHSFKEKASVDKVKVDLDAGLVTIITKEGQDISDADIKSTITDAGFDVTKIERI